jgi:hypothetical protein
VGTPMWASSQHVSEDASSRTLQRPARLVSDAVVDAVGSSTAPRTR